MHIRYMASFTGSMGRGFLPAVLAWKLVAEAWWMDVKRRMIITHIELALTGPLIHAILGHWRRGRPARPECAAYRACRHQGTRRNRPGHRQRGECRRERLGPYAFGLSPPTLRRCRPGDPGRPRLQEARHHI